MRGRPQCQTTDSVRLSHYSQISPLVGESLDPPALAYPRSNASTTDRGISVKRCIDHKSEYYYQQQQKTPPTRHDAAKLSKGSLSQGNCHRTATEKSYKPTERRLDTILLNLMTSCISQRCVIIYIMNFSDHSDFCSASLKLLTTPSAT